MNRNASIVVLLCVVALGLALMGVAQAQSGPRVTRSINPSSVPAGGGMVTVTIMITGEYGIGSVAENLPAGFSYVDGSVSPSDITVGGGGRNVTFPLLGENSFSYRANTSASAGQHQFSGTLTYGIDKETASVGGDSTVTVAQEATPTPTHTPTPTTPAPAGPRATRSINPSSVPAGGGMVTVTIMITGEYGIGSVAENLPAGFSYVDGSVSPSDITVGGGGRNVTFSLIGENSFSYRANTSASAGQHGFSGTLTYGIDKETASVGGDSTVTVAQEATPTVRATRSINPSSVPAGGGEVTVTIRITGEYSIGSVAENLPAGFSYVDGSVSPSDITVGGSGRNVTFSLLGENSFSYRANTSASAGQHQFSGTLTYGIDKKTAIVGGDNSVRVGPPPSRPQPPPPSNSPPRFSETAPTRSIAENSAAGAAVGAPVRATDSDGDSLTYTLGGSDAATFSIGRTSGQLMTRAALDYETKPSYSVGVTARDNRGGSDTTTVAVAVANVEEQGTVTLNPDRPLVGTALTASLTDPDGGVTGETWQWSRSDAADGTFTGIGGATRASYTPVEADYGMYLKITVTYTDGHGPDKTATASAMVPPPSNSPPRFSETAPTRSIAENSAAGTAVGAPVRATDPDGDSLTYTLGGSDAATFSIGRTSGQLMARAALDYETKPSYSVGVTARDNSGGSDTTTVAVAVTNVEEQGTVTLNPDRPLVGTALTASLTDPDGGVTGETWRWSRSDAADGTFTGIGGATRASYTPVEADDGMYLKITVTYTDGHGPNKTATAGAMVSDPLIARYDANKDGTIEIRELFNAIDHYFDGTIELSELFKVIDYYFDG